MIKDFLGNEITVGCEIVYAANVGRSSVLVHAEVVALHEVDNTDKSYDRKAPLRVRAKKRPYGNDWCDKERLISLLYPERCLVVS